MRGRGWSTHALAYRSVPMSSREGESGTRLAGTRARDRGRPPHRVFRFRPGGSHRSIRDHTRRSAVPSSDRLNVNPPDSTDLCDSVPGRPRPPLRSESPIPRTRGPPQSVALTAEGADSASTRDRRGTVVQAVFHANAAIHRPATRDCESGCCASERGAAGQNTAGLPMQRRDKRGCPRRLLVRPGAPVTALATSVHVPSRAAA
jgi:hypothetical protein